MTAPAVIEFPTLDQDAIEKYLEQAKVIASGAEIRTRSQVILEASEAEVTRLTAEGKEMREQIRRLEENIAQFNKVLELMKLNEQDVALELSVALTNVNMLRKAGV